MATCFLVLGTPRSGTSCVAGILHKLGVRMSLGDFVPASPANPTGFWEDAEFVRSLFAPIPFELTLVQEYQLNAALNGLLSARCAAGVDWGVKTYKAGLMLSKIVDLCQMPVEIIRTYRPRQQSKSSWANAFNPATDWFVDYMWDIVDALPGDTFTVAFDDLLANPVASVAAIAAKVGKPTSGPAFDDAVAFVDPSLRNYP